MLEKNYKKIVLKLELKYKHKFILDDQPLTSKLYYISDIKCNICKSVFTLDLYHKNHFAEDHIITNDFYKYNNIYYIFISQSNKLLFFCNEFIIKNIIE